MGRENKYGLLVGVGFIVLFGVILSSRAGSVTQEHASMPVGESRRHEQFTRTDDRADAGFTLVVPKVTEVLGDTAAREESLPAPERVAPAETAPPEDAASPADGTGLLAFLPETVRTPMEALPAPEGPPPGPPVAPPVAPPPAPEPRTVHVVQSRETLTRIARRYYGQEDERLWRQIWEANKATVPDPNRLVEGQELVIPGLPAPAPAPAPAGTVLVDNAAGEEPRSVTADDLGRMFGLASDLLEQPPATPATYTVRKNDTFYHIAEQQYGNGQYGRLLALKNKHLVPDPRKLKVGQRIVLLDGPDLPKPETAVAQR